MAVTPQQLANLWGTNPDNEVTRIHALAEGLITEALAEAWRDPTEAVRDQMVIDVAGELSRRGEAPSGSSQYADFTTGQPVRAPRDPLTLVLPILRRYVTGV